jgi:hypothetical protein
MGFDFKAFFLAKFFIKVSKLIFCERGCSQIWGFAQSYPQKLWTTGPPIIPVREMNSAIIHVQAMARTWGAKKGDVECCPSYKPLAGRFGH